jgi:hypothetical protein
VEGNFKSPNTMPVANYKTIICRHWEKGNCYNVDCTYAHGVKELRKHCGFGTRCRAGLQCRHPHHPEDLEYFQLKSEKPKETREMSTQTEDEIDELIVKPPQEFTDDFEPKDFICPPPPYEEPTPIYRKERHDKGQPQHHRCGLCRGYGHNRRTCPSRN